MKKLAVILVITFISALVLSSCNRETCPAYSQAETEQAGHVG
jgi:PBP1b-binding outer membrane lipoprotein LpoB